MGVLRKGKFWDTGPKASFCGRTCFPKPKEKGRRTLQCPYGQMMGRQLISGQSSKRIGNWFFFAPERQSPLAGERAEAELGKLGAPSLFLLHGFLLAR